MNWVSSPSPCSSDNIVHSSTLIIKPNQTKSNQELMADSSHSKNNPHILIIPFPAQGHIIPLLDFTNLLISQHHHLSITFLTTPKNLYLLQPLILSSSPNFKPLILPFPPSPDIPTGIENVQDLSGHDAFLLMIDALRTLSHPILEWARAHSNPPRAIISDFFVGWTKDTADSLGIPRIVFFPSGAFSVSVVEYLWVNEPGRPEDDSSGIVISDVPGCPVFKWGEISPLYRKYRESNRMIRFVKENFVANISSWGRVYNSWWEMEGKYLDHIGGKSDGNKRVWCVGPLALKSNAGQRGGPSSARASEILTWLDEKEEGSVVYVCFGSKFSLTDRQMSELGAGLEACGQPFLWCIKEDPREGYGQVPEGFVERVKNRGLVVSGWAPQVLILKHQAIGCFLTHCGWNSILEGLAMGMPLLTWPITADQYANAELVVNELHAGVKISSGLEGSVDMDAFVKVVQQVIQPDGEMRLRARELRRSALEAVKEAGSSANDFDAFVKTLHNLPTPQKVVEDGL